MSQFVTVLVDASMSSGDHPLWAYFHNLGVKQNKSHYFSYCKGCVENQQKLLQEAGTYDDAEWKAKGPSFVAGVLSFFRKMSF